jgi:hypothetical protein
VGDGCHHGVLRLEVEVDPDDPIRIGTFEDRIGAPGSRRTGGQMISPAEVRWLPRSSTTPTVTAAKRKPGHGHVT